MGRIAPAARFIPGFRQRLGLALGPALFLAAGFTLSRAGLASEQAWTAATVALMACWWITEPFPLWATACLPLPLFPIIGAAPLHEVALQYVDPINFLFLGGMLIAASMQQWGLHRRIALGIVAKIGTSPRRIVLGFMLATGFITLWISNTATAVMMFPIAMAVLKKFEEQRGRDDPLLQRFGLALMLGLAYAASIGGIGTKIGTGTNLVFVKQAREIGLEIDFVTWLKLGMPVVLLALPLVWVYLVRFAAPLPAQEFPGGREAIEQERATLGRMHRGEKVALVGFLTAAFLWMFRKDIEIGAFIIPGWWDWVPWTWQDILGRPLKSLPDPFPSLLSDVGDGAVGMIVGASLLLIPVQRRPVRFALEVRGAAKISWGLLVILGGGFAMAYGVQKSGLSNSVGEVVQAAGRHDPLFVTFLVCFVTLLLTEVASNTATASILLPLLASGATTLEMNPAPLMLAAAMSASFGFMLPAGTPPNAVAFSSGYITVPQMVRAGLMVDLFGGLLIGTLSYFVAPLVLRL